MKPRDYVRDIVGAGHGVYTNDAGNGSGGPGYLSADELREMMDSGEIDHYDIINDTDNIIAKTLRAHAHNYADSEWEAIVVLEDLVLAARDSEDGTYTHYLVLYVL